MAAVRNVLIVGAGMAGVTLGVALKRARIACEIAEIRPDLTEPGTGISLQGPALRALHAIGAMERCVERGFGYSYFKTCDAAGNVTGTVDLPRLRCVKSSSTEPSASLRALPHDRRNSELLGEWEKNPSAPNVDTVGVVARSYKALSQPV